jgi:hypothetical protein
LVVLLATRVTPWGRSSTAFTQGILRSTGTPGIAVQTGITPGLTLSKGRRFPWHSTEEMTAATGILRKYVLRPLFHPELEF